MKKRLLVLILLAAIAGAGYYTYMKFPSKSTATKLYGAIDMRTTTLAFESSARIQTLNVHEGDKIEVGQTLGTLDMSAYELARDEAQASLEVAQSELDLLLAGNRIEEIEEGRARLAAAEANHGFADGECRRESRLGTASSKQRRAQACTEAAIALAKVEEARKSLDLLLAGTRIEKIDVAKANRKLAKTRLAQANRALRECTLVSPVEGTIRSRLKEPGDMAGASIGVYEVSLTDPIWARVWIDEVNLGKVKLGQKVKLSCDAYPNESFEGTVGFISSQAEFTPKTVQTEEIRTSLVYEVRITVKDPASKLRLGMPVTITLR